MANTSMRAGALIAFMVATGAGCSAAESAGSGATITVRDSAGIEIVEQALGGGAPRAAFRLADSASVVFGRAEGEEPYLFSNVSAAIRLSDGRIVVADGRAGELRYFDATGTHVRTVGRRGGGPGEFAYFGLVMRLPGDTLLVHDPQHARFTVIAPSGEIARTTTARPLYDAAGVRFMQFRGRLADGRLVGSHYPRRAQPPSAGLRVDSAVYRVLDLDAVTADSLVTLYQSTAMYSRFESGQFVEIGIMSIPLTTEASVAVAGDGLYHTDGRRYVIAKYAPSGAVARVIRLDRTPAAVTDSVIAEAIARAAAPLPPDRRPESERRMRELPLPDTLPAFSALLVDEAQRLWAREWSIDPEGPSTWLVFSPEGRLLGAAGLPARCTPLEIGRDHVLCRQLDDLDIERVELRAIVPIE